MQLEKVGNRWIFSCSFEDKYIPKEAGFRWDPAAKEWYTVMSEVAVKLINFADKETAAAFGRIETDKQRAIAASRADAANIVVPAPAGLQYLPFQLAGIAYTQKRNNVLIADEMGLGKTIQALGLINSDPGIRRVLVICPASLKINWAREAAKWLVRPMTIGIVAEKKGKKQNTFPATDMVIINYEQLRKFRQETHRQPWDLLVVDECHRIKNPGAQRTAEVLGKWSANHDKKILPIPAGRKMFLTGTPILNRPIELWTLVKALGIFDNWMEYIKRYCAGFQEKVGWDKETKEAKMVWNTSGASNLGELQEKLRSTIMVRRMKQDVLLDLPPKTRQVVTISADGYEGLLRTEKSAWAEHRKAIGIIQAEVDALVDDGGERYRQAVKKLQASIGYAFSEVSRIRHDLALAKVPAVIDHLCDVVESTGKVVCFAHHLDVIAAITAAFGDEAVAFTGQHRVDQKDAAVTRFQTDPSCKVFVGGIMAAGFGITLTASSHVVFAELDWVPGNINQAEDRCHRIGQHDNVSVQHLVVEESMDADMAQTLIKKQAVIDKALNVQTREELSRIEALVREAVVPEGWI